MTNILLICKSTQMAQYKKTSWQVLGLSVKCDSAVEGFVHNGAQLTQGGECVDRHSCVKDVSDS